MLLAWSHCPGQLPAFERYGAIRAKKHGAGHLLFSTAQVSACIHQPACDDEGFDPADSAYRVSFPTSLSFSFVCPVFCSVITTLCCSMLSQLDCVG